jgi:hypothetical protein
MNDEELLATVKEQQPTIPMTVPIQQIMRHGRRVRARRQVPAVVATLAGVAVAVLVLQPSGHPARTGAQLAAWTVVKQTDGTVDVSIRELRNPSGLQTALRDDGVPANVIFDGSSNAQPNQCESYGHGKSLQQVVTLTAPEHPHQNAIAMTIRPAALPTATGLQIITSHANTGVHLVVASNACTG